jgi:hypothetical protein
LGSDFKRLQLSNQALIYSAAEYAYAVWNPTTTTQIVDTALNQAMRVISGAFQPATTALLPMIYGIAPPNKRRNHHVLKLSAMSHEPGAHIPPIDYKHQCIKQNHFVKDA